MLKDLPSGECRDHRLDMARLLTKPGDWESVSNAYEALGMTKTFATTNAAVKRDFTPPEQGCSTARSGSPRSPTGCSSVTPRRGPSDEPTASTWTRCSTGWCRRAILDEAGGSPRGSALRKDGDRRRGLRCVGGGDRPAGRPDLPARRGDRRVRGVHPERRRSARPRELGPGIRKASGTTCRTLTTLPGEPPGGTARIASRGCRARRAHRGRVAVRGGPPGRRGICSERRRSRRAGAPPHVGGAKRADGPATRASAGALINHLECAHLTSFDLDVASGALTLEQMRTDAADS